jgi:hypothetical protein
LTSILHYIFCWYGRLVEVHEVYTHSKVLAVLTFLNQYDLTRKLGGWHMLDYSGFQELIHLPPDPLSPVWW